jgi:hypothetical protein
MSRVLVVIYDNTFAELIAYNLQRSEFQFDIICGKDIRSTPVGVFVGLNRELQPVVIDLSSYEVALVDQELAGDRSGCWLVSEMVSNGITCVAISPFHQATLRAAGAQIACDPGVLVSFITDQLAAVCLSSRNHRQEVSTAA